MNLQKSLPVQKGLSFVLFRNCLRELELNTQKKNFRKNFESLFETFLFTISDMKDARQKFNSNFIYIYVYIYIYIFIFIIYINIYFDKIYKYIYL